MLYTYVEDKILDHKRRMRIKKLDMINFKLFCDIKYRDKNDFFEFQIESQMRQLIPSFLTQKDEQSKQTQEISLLRRKIMKN